MTKKRRLKHRNSIKRHTREYRWTIKAKLGNKYRLGRKAQQEAFSTLVHATILLLWSKSGNS